MGDKKQKTDDTEGLSKPGVIYVGHIPHGFYEDQIRKYFSQFGIVTGVFVARSGKTGRSRGYGFVHFACNEVAKVAAETMNNYLMFDRLLKCHVLSQDKLQPACIATRPKVLLSAKQRMLREQRRHNQAKTMLQREKQLGRLLASERKKRAKLKELGIDYEFPGYKAATFDPKQRVPSHTVFIDEDEKPEQNPT